MISTIAFFIGIIPLSFLLHEIGHGIGAGLTSDSDIHIYLGANHEQNKENFRIGRFHFHLQFAYMGFCVWEDRLNKRQSFFTLIGGPLMTLLVMVGFLILRDTILVGEARTLFVKAAEFNLILFFSTTLPFRYPRWMGKSMAGMNSNILKNMPLSLKRLSSS